MAAMRDARSGRTAASRSCKGSGCVALASRKESLSLSLSPSVSLSLSLLVPQRWRIDGNDESGKCLAAPRGHLDANAGMSVPAAKGHLNVVLLF